MNVLEVYPQVLLQNSKGGCRSYINCNVARRSHTMRGLQGVHSSDCSADPFTIHAPHRHIVKDGDW
jgi:hypothetical protein